MTTLPDLVAIIDDTRDPFYIACIGFGQRQCDNEPLPNSPYCEACKAAADDFHARIQSSAYVARMAAHVKAELADLAIAPIVRRVLKSAA